LLKTLGQMHIAVMPQSRLNPQLNLCLAAKEWLPPK
jgi:hypothetical protein